MFFHLIPEFFLKVILEIFMVFLKLTPYLFQGVIFFYFTFNCNFGLFPHFFICNLSEVKKTF